MCSPQRGSRLRDLTSRSQREPTHRTPRLALVRSSRGGRATDETRSMPFSAEPVGPHRRRTETSRAASARSRAWSRRVSPTPRSRSSCTSRRAPQRSTCRTSWPSSASGTGPSSLPGPSGRAWSTAANSARHGPLDVVCWCYRGKEVVQLSSDRFWDLGGGWPLGGPLDHLANPRQQPTDRRLGNGPARHGLSQSSKRLPEPLRSAIRGATRRP